MKDLPWGITEGWLTGIEPAASAATERRSTKWATVTILLPILPSFCLSWVRRRACTEADVRRLKCSQEESNFYFPLRRRTLYPLSYGSSMSGIGESNSSIQLGKLTLNRSTNPASSLRSSAPAHFFPNVVGVGRLELPVSSSQTRRSTNWATPRSVLTLRLKPKGSAPSEARWPGRELNPHPLARTAF